MSSRGNGRIAWASFPYTISSNFFLPPSPPRYRGKFSFHFPPTLTIHPGPARRLFSSTLHHRPRRLKRIRRRMTLCPKLNAKFGEWRSQRVLVVLVLFARAGCRSPGSPETPLCNVIIVKTSTWSTPNVVSITHFRKCDAEKFVRPQKNIFVRSSVSRHLWSTLAVNFSSTRQCLGARRELECRKHGDG